MARKWHSSWELNTTTADVEFTTLTNSPTIVTTPVHSGTYSGRISSMTSGNEKSFRYQFLVSDATGPFYFRTYIYIATLPSAANRIIRLNSSITSMRAEVKLDNTGVLTLFDEDGQITGNSSALSLNTWYYIELLFDASGSAGSHTVTAKLDGTIFATASDRSLSSGINVFRVGGNLGAEAQTTGDWYFDDYVINDGTGSFQNSYAGAGQIIHMLPDSAGDANAWTRAGSDTGANYSQVNEVTPDDSSTINQSTTLNQEDLFNLAASPSSIGTNDTINVVAVGVRFSATNTPSVPTFRVEIEASSGGTIEQSGNITPTVTNYRTNDPAIPRNYPLVLYDLPGASAQGWTKATLDTAQIGYKLTADSTNSDIITTIWLSVDSTPFSDITQFVSSTTNGAASGTSASATTPAGLQVGDVLIAEVHTNGGAGDGQSITDNNGATPFTDSGLGIRRYNSDSGSYRLYHRVVGSSEPASYAWTLGASDRWVVNISAYRGVDTSTIYDVAPTSSSENTGSSTTAATNSITTLTNGAMIVAVGGSDSSTITFSATPSGFNSRQNNSGEQLAALADLYAPTTTTQGSVSWTLSSSNGWFTNVFALKPTAGAVTTFQKSPFMTTNSFWGS